MMNKKKENGTHGWIGLFREAHWPETRCRPKELVGGENERNEEEMLDMQMERNGAGH